MPDQFLIQSDGGFILLSPAPGDLIIDTGRNTLLQDPRRLTFTQWAATVTADNNIGPLPIDEGNWKDWAQRVYQITGNTPDPDLFGDWQSWALAWLGST